MELNKKVFRQFYPNSKVREAKLEEELESLRKRYKANDMRLKTFIEQKEVVRKSISERHYNLLSGLKEGGAKKKQWNTLSP